MAGLFVLRGKFRRKLFRFAARRLIFGLRLVVFCSVVSKKHGLQAIGIVYWTFGRDKDGWSEAIPIVPTIGLRTN
jgi:hypothetical protein